ncbi:MAG: DUF5995 family protein [Actinomycetota bacterium]
MGLRDWLSGVLTRRQDEVTLVLPPEEPATIEDVIARMRLIQAQLPPRDGVAQFNRMYLTVTEEVLQQSVDHEFEDKDFVERLDVVFANLYFMALEDHARDPQACARCWVPLFQSRGSSRIAPLQFALAGMNAHINHDLVLALNATCREMQLDPERDSAQYRDFSRINSLLAEAQEKVEPWFKKGLLGIIDRVLGQADEAVEMWSMERARENAWVQSEALWLLRAHEQLTARFLLALDRTVGFAGRGLLFERPL